MARLIAIETAAEWMEILGYYATDNEGEQHLHPIAPASVLVPLLDEHDDDEQVLAALRASEDGCDVPEEAALDLIDYARRGLDAGRTVEDALRAAVAAHDAGDVTERDEQLEIARRAEDDYGDDPATRAVRDALTSEDDE